MPQSSRFELVEQHLKELHFGSACNEATAKLTEDRKIESGVG
jgi:hypothetical protein